MIDVPYEVKKALREGTYRKNYRFIVQKETITRQIINVGELSSATTTYTVTTAGRYILYNEYNSHAFDDVVVSLPDGGGSESFPCPIGTDETWFEIPVDLPLNTTISIYSFNTDKVFITMTDFVWYGPAWTDYCVIDNNNLIKESVNIDERMCSGDTIKYGLCEGASLEFQYFEKLYITGGKIQAFCDVSYKVDSVVVDADHELAPLWVTKNATVTFTLTDGLYAIINITRNGETTSLTLADDGPAMTYECKYGDTISVYENGGSFIAEADEAIFDEWESIPMGYFDVKKCSRQASTGIIKVTAYNKLQSDYLDVKANESVLTQFVDENPEILIYDLKRALLSEYQIEEAEVVNVMRNPIGTGMDLDDGSATKFTNLYGDTGPINPTNIGVNLNTEFNIAVLTYTNEWDLDPTKYYRIDSRYNLDVFEQSFFDYYRGLIVNSFINIDTDVYMQNLVTLCKGDIYTNPTLRTWKNIFAIVLTKEDDSTECYTLVGQQYGLNNIYGGMHDLTKRTITGYKKIEVWVPIRLERYVKISSSQWTIDRILNFGGKPIRYEYLSEYTEERMVNYWPAFKYPDGAEISNGIRPHMFMSINEIDSLSDADKITVNLNDLPDFTMRDIVTASYETQCQFGQLSRITDLFAGVELGHSRLLPAETLYPTTNLYPGGARLSGSKAMYSKLWADEGNIHKWRNLIITYKGLDEEENEKEFTLQKQVNADGTDDYNCSDNWLFKNLVWTESQIEDYADAMVAKMAGITWFPFEMWCAGLPYLETGDEIEIPLGDQKYVSYVLQRQLKGIQNLQDTYINGTLDIY